MDNLLFGKFKVGEVVRFNPRQPDSWAAPTGALAIVKGKHYEYLVVKWLRNPHHEQRDGGYYPVDFEKYSRIPTIRLEDLI